MQILNVFLINVAYPMFLIWHFNELQIIYQQKNEVIVQRNSEIAAIKNAVTIGMSEIQNLV